jgi:hypothetical protein
MKHKTSELSGDLLDAAVAKAEGLEIHPGRDRYVVVQSIDKVWADEISPSRLWSHAGPIIERERISISFKHRRHSFDTTSGDWCAHIFVKGSDLMLPGSYLSDPGSGEEKGAHLLFSADDPLIAAMRAYVASKFGDEVEL